MRSHRHRTGCWEAYSNTEPAVCEGRGRLAGVLMAHPKQQTPNVSRRTAFGGKTTEHWISCSTNAQLSRGRVSLKGIKKGNLFGQTPAKRKITQTSHLQENISPQIDFLLRKQWTLYSVTPMYRFSYSRLQQYSRQLSLFIAAEKQKNPVMDIEPDSGFKVVFSSISELKNTEQDQPAVLIEIMQRTQVATENKGDKVMWAGLFCCTCADDILDVVTEDFTCLPLFLVKGGEGLLAIVGTWFQQTFDCCFSALPINSLNLAWMAAMWTGSKTDKDTTATELTFSVPCSPYPLDISYAIHPEDANALWNTIHHVPGEVRQEEVDLFMESLFSHFYRHFKIYLSAARLVKVSTSVASAHSDGKIKVWNLAN